MLYMTFSLTEPFTKESFGISGAVQKAGFPKQRRLHDAGLASHIGVIPPCGICHAK